MEIVMKLPVADLPTFSDIKPGELFSFSHSGGLYLKLCPSMPDDNAAIIKPAAGSPGIPGGVVYVVSTAKVCRVGQITVNLECKSP